MECYIYDLNYCGLYISGATIGDPVPSGSGMSKINILAENNEVDKKPPVGVQCAKGNAPARLIPGTILSLLG